MIVWLILILASCFLVFAVARIVWMRMPLLRATVGTADGHSYKVHFEELRDDVQPVEYIWLSLYFVSNTLYILDLNNVDLRDQWDGLRRSLRVLAGEEPDALRHAMSLSGLTMVTVAEGDRVSGKRISLTLGFRDVMTRTLIGAKVPMASIYPQFLVSPIAVMELASRKLDARARCLLHAALSLMTKWYDSGLIDPRSVHALADAPRRAFTAAALASK